MWGDGNVIKQVKCGWLWWSLSDFSKLKKYSNRKLEKQLQWNQFLKRNKDIKQRTNDIGPISLLLNENESEIYTKFSKKQEQLFQTISTFQLNLLCEMISWNVKQCEI